MIYWAILALCSAGPILPDETKPIELQWNNAGFSSRYLFNFWISTDIPSDAKVTIDFPAQYAAGLGTIDCISYRITDRDAVSITCTIVTRTLTLDISHIKAGSHQFRIENI